MKVSLFVLLTVAVTFLFVGSGTCQQREPPSEQKTQPPASSTDLIPQLGKTLGSLDVLSDTMGVDFGPYLQRVLHDVKINWYNLIPENARPPIMKKGKVAIEFAILKNGRIRGMRLEDGGSSGDVALDRAAWGGITASNPFPPLPPEFGGQYLAVRFHFFYNPDKNDLDANTNSTGTSRKSGISVKIYAPSTLTVRTGGSQIILAAVTGTTNAAVKWKVSGVDCSGARCGSMQGDLYIAPDTLPNPPSVTLTAISEADPAASAWITITLFEPKNAK